MRLREPLDQPQLNQLTVLLARLERLLGTCQVSQGRETIQLASVLLDDLTDDCYIQWDAELGRFKSATTIAFSTEAQSAAPVGDAGGDLTGSYPDPEIASGVIVDDMVDAAAAITESKLALNYATHSNTNDPTSDQKAALAGTSGTPSSSNKYVTNSDSRFTATAIAMLEPLGPMANLSAVAMTANYVYLHPFVMPAGLSLSTAYITVRETAADAGKHWQVGIYSADSPSAIATSQFTLQCSCASQECAANTSYRLAVTVPVTLTGGLYWMGFTSDSGTATFYCVPGGTTAHRYALYTTSGGGATLPSTIAYGSRSSYGYSFPWILIDSNS